MADGPKLRTVRVDAFGLPGVAARYRLRPGEQLVLLTLVCQASWRTQEWRGSKADLAGSTRMAPATVDAAVRKLSDLGLVEEVEPFRQGAAGCLFLRCYCMIVDPEHCTSLVGPSGEIYTNPQIDQGERVTVGAGGVEGNRRKIHTGSTPDLHVKVTDLHFDQGKRGGPKEQRDNEGTDSPRAVVGAGDDELEQRFDEWAGAADDEPGWDESPEEADPEARAVGLIIGKFGAGCVFVDPDSLEPLPVADSKATHPGHRQPLPGEKPTIGAIRRAARA